MTKPNITLPDTTWALDLLWVGLLAMYAFAGYAVTPFHGDESMQIFMSHDYAYTFQDRDLNEVRYDPEKSLINDLEQNLRLLNGSVNKYTIGVAWDRAGFTREDLNGPWYWDESYQFNIDNGFYPGDDLLLVSRVPSSIFTAAAVVATFFAAKAFAGRPVAYMAAAYMALNPALLLNGRRAMMEGSMLFGAALTLMAAMYFIRADGWRTWAATALLALAAGFAVAAKHTNVIAVAALFLGCGLYALTQLRTDGPSHIGRNLTQLTIAGVLSIGVFILFNPPYWGNPVQVASAVLNERIDLLNGQVETFGGYSSPAEQLLGFYQMTFVGQPQYFEVQSFRDAAQPQITTYEATPYAGVYLPGIGLPLLAVFLIGCGVIFGLLPLQDIHPGTRWLVGSYTAMTTLFVLFTVPLDWQRYYLPMAPVVAMVAPLGIMWVTRLYMRDAAEESPQYKKGSARVQSS
ncbi:MAG: phospholipid carrier-dependent glycosyltransferase [Chloroflexota bacterium]